MIVLENALQGAETFRDKLNEFGTLACFKADHQKMKMLMKNMTAEDPKILMEKTGFQINKKVKYLGITMTNANCMSFQNNYVKMGETKIVNVRQDFCDKDEYLV